MLTLHLIILLVLGSSLVILSILKNSFLFLFNKSKAKLTYTKIELLKEVFGNRIIGFIWVVPYKILDDRNYDIKTNQYRDKFHIVAKIHIYIWSILVIYALLYVVKNR
jgi:hypothetical protein